MNLLESFSPYELLESLQYMSYMSPVAQCVAQRAPYAAVRMVAGSHPVLVIT